MTSEAEVLNAVLVTAPIGVCQCGCGRKTGIRTHSRRNGEPYMFCKGHHPVTRKISKLENRFWSHVEKTETCWVWTGCKDGKGYGRIGVQYAVGHKGWKARICTRVLYEEILKIDIAGLHVLHHCDNPACVRPDHLFLGTQDSNMKDMASKKRSPKGDVHWSRRMPQRVARGESKSTLTEVNVLDMHRLFASGTTQIAIAKLFNVGRQQVARILSGKRWKHVYENL